jgi:hypothetical protein
MVPQHARWREHCVCVCALLVQLTCCSEKLSDWPVARNQAALIAPVVAKAQQLPAWAKECGG